MKIKFLAGCQPGSRFHLNPVYYFLKSFYKKTGKHFERYSWLKTEYHLESIDDISNRIENENPDIICASMFIWNWDLHCEILQKAKNQNPNLKIILGGPEVNAQNEPDFFDRYPWVDYVIYGDGELAFQMLLDSFYGDIDPTSISNLITSSFKNRHEVFKFKNYPAYNTFLDLKNDFIQDVEDVRKLHEDNWFVNYERVRGCPYDCAFCNWSSGLHHKVNVRNSDWKAEVDLFANLNLKVKFNDANFGIFKEDMEVLDYIIEARQKRRNNFIMFPRNFAKLQKQVGFDMMDKISTVDSSLEIKISLQDIDQTILNNIYRPDVPWEEHKRLIVKHREKHPKSEIILELITGLPGTTIESVENQYYEYCDIPASYLYCYEWVLLKNSPAYSKDYRDKYNLQDYNMFFIAGDVFETEESLINRIQNKNLNGIIGHNQQILIDREFGLEGLLYQFYLNSLYILLYYRYGNKLNRIIFQSYLDKLKPEILKTLKEDAIYMMKTHAEQGFLIFGKYVKDEQKFRLYNAHIEDFLRNLMY